jgi:WD40 repeat protein
MRRHALWLSVLSLLVCGGVCSAADETSKDTPRGTTIPPEPVPLRPGGGLSVRTPVARPGVVKGVRSWTIETRRHRWAATNMALSPDGTLVATSGYDGMVRLWDTQTGELKRVLVGHDSYSYGLTWSADGRYLASAGSFDYTVRVWEARTGLPLKVLRGLKDAPITVAFSPDGALLAAGTGGSGYVPVWQVAKGKLLKTAETGKPVLDLAFSPDGRTLACAVSEVGVSLLAAPDWTATSKIDLTGQNPRGLSFLAGGKELVAGGDKHLVVWDVAAKKVVRKLDGNVAGLARHGNRVAVASSPGKVIDLKTGTPGAALPPAQAVGWSSDGKAIYLLAGDEVVRVDPDKGTLLTRWSVAESGYVSWAPGRPVLTGVPGVEPRLWETTTGKLLHTLKGHTAMTTSAAWSPGGKIVATGGYDRTVRVWSPATGKLLRTLGGFETAVTALAVAGDGRIAAGLADGKVRIFAADATKPLRTHAAHTDAVKTLAWGRDGRLASGGVDAVVHIWGTDAKKPVRSLENAGSVECVAFAPSGKWLAAGSSENRVNVWSYPGGKLVQEWSALGSPPAVSALAWAPDSNLLLVGRANHTLQLWDLKLGKKEPRQSFVVMAPVHGVAWAAGGKTMVTCTIDRGVRFWNTATGQLLATLLAEKDQMCCVAAEGHYRVPNDAATELVYVVLTATGMDTHAPKAFAAKYRWKNDPTRARMVGR